jgi:hypothetical protein
VFKKTQLNRHSMIESVKGKSVFRVVASKHIWSLDNISEIHWVRHCKRVFGLIVFFI